MLRKLSRGSLSGLRGNGVLVSPWWRWKWLNQVYGPTDPRGLQVIWLPRNQDLLPKGSEGPPQMVFTRGHITAQRFSDSVFISFTGKIRRLSERGMAASEENKPLLELESPCCSFSTRDRHIARAAPPARRTGLGDNGMKASAFQMVRGKRDSGEGGLFI